MGGLLFTAFWALVVWYIIVDYEETQEVKKQIQKGVNKHE